MDECRQPGKLERYPYLTPGIIRNEGVMALLYKTITGHVYYQPIDVAAFILSTKKMDVGSVVTEAFSPGVIVSYYKGSASLVISFNKDKGWSGPSSFLRDLEVGSNIFDTMVKAAK